MLLQAAVPCWLMLLVNGRLLMAVCPGSSPHSAQRNWPSWYGPRESDSTSSPQNVQEAWKSWLTNDITRATNRPCALSRSPLVPTLFPSLIKKAAKM